MRDQYNETEIAVLIAKVVCGEATQQEQQELERLAIENVEIRNQWDDTQKLWEVDPKFDSTPEVFDSNKAWEKVSKELFATEETKVRSINSKVWLAIAASLVVGILALTTLIKPYFSSDKAISSTGRIVADTLPDNSEFVLGANSSLHYKESDFENQRALILEEGKVYLHVRKANGAKFTVQTDNALVTVVGTRFTVQKEIDGTKVLVEEGKVKVKALNNANDSLFLTKGMCAIVRKNTVELLASNPNEMAWATHKLVFENMPLTKVIDELSDTYGKAIVLQGNNLQNQLISARFTNQDLDEVLMVISNLYHIEVTQTKDSIILHR